MLLSWEIVCTLFLVFICYKLIRLWTYWLLRGVKTVGVGPLIGPLFKVWTGRLTIPGLSQHIFSGYKGHPYVGTWLLAKPALIVLDPVMVNNILSKNYNDWPDRGFRDDPSLDPLSSHLVNIGGKKWRLLKSWIDPGMGMMGIRERHDILMAGAELLVRCLKGKKAETLESTQKMTISVLSRAVMGKDEFPDDVVTLLKETFIASFWTTMRSVMRLACPKVLTAIGYKRFGIGSETSFLRLVEHRLHGPETKSQDLMQLLINAFKIYKASQPHDECINENVLASNAFVILAAGYHPTATSLALGLFDLARSPDVQIRLQAELDTVLADGPITQQALPSLKYLNDVVSEMLRLYPTVTMTCRTAACDTRLGDLQVSKGLRVIVPIFALQRDPRYFPDPDTFRPERFTETPELRQMAYLPFGKGPRICTGWRLALTMMKLAVATILKDHNLSVSPETKIPVKFAENSLFLALKHPIFLELHPRGR